MRCRLILIPRPHLPTRTGSTIGLCPGNRRAGPRRGAQEPTIFSPTTGSCPGNRLRASKLSAERAHAMDYYNGDMSRDMPAADGRSRAVSTDVADTIDGLMP